MRRRITVKFMGIDTRAVYKMYFPHTFNIFHIYVLIV